MSLLFQACVWIVDLINTAELYARGCYKLFFVDRRKTNVFHGLMSTSTIIRLEGPKLWTENTFI